MYKPGGIPVHGCGPYNRLSLVDLLGAMEGRTGSSYHTLHRLDRLTSGVLLLAQDKTTAAVVSQQFRDGHVKKRYLAIVEGRFPLHPLPSSSNSSSEHSATDLAAASDTCDSMATEQCAWMKAFKPARVATQWRDVDGIDERAVPSMAAAVSAVEPSTGKKRARPAGSADVDLQDAAVDEAMASTGLRVSWSATGHLTVNVPCTTLDK